MSSRIWPSKLKSITPIYFVLTLAVVTRLAWVLFSPALPTSDFGWYENRAVEIIEGRGYSVGGVPTAHRLPGYVLFLAAIHYVFDRSLLAAKLANVFLGVLTVYLTYMIALKTFSKRIALVAAIMVALTPSLILYAGLLASENLFTSLFLSSLLAFLQYLHTRKQSYTLLSGITLGLAVLIRPAVLLLPGLWLLYLLFKQEAIRRVAAQAALMGLPIIVCLLAWTVRNYVRLERFIPLSTDAGSVLLISFNESSTGRYSVPEEHRIIDERAQALDWDEYQRGRALREEAVSFIQKHPARALMLAPLKVFQLFRDDVSGVTWNFEDTSRPLPRWLWWSLLAIAQGYYMIIMGLALATFFYRKALKSYPWYGLLLMPIIYWIGFHLVFFGDDRYHLPILPIITVLSAFGLTQIVGSRREKGTSRQSTGRDSKDKTSDLLPGEP
jgi:4-amino-4-deoxy-L-arabinose transferase-like glycosyltransferase